MGQELTRKRVKGKLIFKHETETDWGQSNYIPEQGEKILYDPDENHNYTRVKYGDGSHTVKDLPFSPSDKIPQFPTTTRDKVLTVNEQGEAEWKDYASLPVFDNVDEIPEDFPEESVYLIPADNGSFVTKAEMSARVDKEAVNRATEINIQKERIDELTKLVPEVTSSDKDKVLTANEDGTAEWKEPLTYVEIHLQDYGVNLYLALLDPSYPTEFENQQLYDVFSNACASDKDIILCCGPSGPTLGYNDVRIYLTQIAKATNGTYQGAGKVLFGVGSGETYGETYWATVTIETRETNGLLWIAAHLDN